MFNTFNENTQSIDDSIRDTDNAPTNIPRSLISCRSIHSYESRRLMTVLFDSDGSHTLIHSRCLPRGANLTLLE